MKLGILVAAASTVLLSPLLSTPAAAETAPAPEKLYYTLSASSGPVGVEAPDGVQIIKIDPSMPITNAKGSGGTSSASGCGRFWVQNTARNLLGSRAFTLRVWTEACWNRARHTVTVQRTGQTIRYVSSQWRYRGITSIDRHFYSAWSGYPRSGYHHYRLVHFENCVLKWGCIGSNYSRQTIRVRSNGTYTWQTDGDS